MAVRLIHCSQSRTLICYLLKKCNLKATFQTFVKDLINRLQLVQDDAARSLTKIKNKKSFC